MLEEAVLSRTEECKCLVTVSALGCPGNMRIERPGRRVQYIFTLVKRLRDPRAGGAGRRVIYHIGKLFCA